MRELILDKLRVLSEDSITTEAIKYALNEEIDKFKPIVDNTDDDNMLGQKYRAYELSKRILNNFFINLEAYKDKKPKGNEINKSK